REQRVITSYVTEQVKGNHLLFKLGTIKDETLGEALRVTIVASGFEGGGKLEIPKLSDLSQTAEEEPDGEESLAPNAGVEEPQAEREVPTPQRANDDKFIVEESVVRSEEHTSELQSRENLVCR